MPQEEVAAVLTIFRAPEMTARDRKNIAKWIRGKADLLEAEGKNLAPKRFTARIFIGRSEQ